MKHAQVGSSSGNNSNLISLNLWLASIGVRPITAWRWRKREWITVQNIAGRCYISRETIADFERRAAAGEFAQVHKAPKKETTTN